MLRFMGLCIVKHKVKKQIMAIHLENINYDTEDSRTKEKCLCFEVCVLCLSSTMESARLYMWQNPVGARRWCEGTSGGRL